jgi:hypothetical protein
MKGYVLQLILQFLPMIINDPGLQAQFAEPVGKALADAIPDVAEDAVGNFLVLAGQSLIDAN